MRNEIKASKRKEQESLFKKIVYRQRSMKKVQEREEVSGKQTSERKEITQQSRSHSRKPQPEKEEAHRS
jgi:hypothetical protein